MVLENLEPKLVWEIFEEVVAKTPHESKKEGKIYNQHYLKLNKLPINSWDARFGFAVLSNGGLSVVPAKNLIENIGLETKLTKLGLNKEDIDFIVKNITFLL